MQPTQQRKIPIRKCSGCQERFPKSELIRVLRTPEGEIVLDLTGKKNGRGAYLCKNPLCIKKAKKGGRIASALECTIPEEIYTRLEEELSSANA